MPRDALFDLAVNRAAVYLRRLSPLPQAATDAEAARAVITSRIELWYLKTRFAYRIPLEEVVTALIEQPEGGAQAEYVWEGGRGGAWRPA